jgi:hypothetical protein
MIEKLREKIDQVETVEDVERLQIVTDVLATIALSSSQITLEQFGLEPEFIEDDEDTIIRSYN